MTYRELYNKRVTRINMLLEALKRDPDNESLKLKIRLAEDEIYNPELKKMHGDADEFYRSTSQELNDENYE